MVSIPHFENLRPSEILEALDLDWNVTEKLDGSYLRAGVDKAGRHYVQRKNAPPCYDLDDWPEEGWTQVFRSAHIMADQLLTHLSEMGRLAPGDWVDFELIYGSMPNTIPYKQSDGLTAMAMVVNHSFEKEQPALYGFKCCSSIHVINSVDGKVLSREARIDNWQIDYPSFWDKHLVQARLSKWAKRLKIVLTDWFPRESQVPGFSILEVLEINLGKKHPNCGDRDWSVLKEQLKQERTELQEVFQAFILTFKDLALRIFGSEMYSSIGPGSFKEGFVVNRHNKLFKFVDRDIFGTANKFTHIIKYWLVGGRRPIRPCFLSRTKDWPIDKRLERLDVLLNRYLDKRWSIHYRLSDGVRTVLVAYSGDLHNRILNLFADTRKRISDGR